MSFTADHEYIRAEFDWLAVDSIGHVGFFATGGDGPVPEKSLEFASALEGIHESICSQPKTCDAREASDVEYYLGDFFDVAERGIFAYNWDFERKEYRLVVLPLSPVCVQDTDMKEIAGQVRLAVEFSNTPWLPATSAVVA